MPPLFFDVRHSTLHDISEEALSRYDLPPSLLNLSHILVADEFPYQPGDFPRIALSEWGPVEGIKLGRLIVPELAELDPPASFSKSIVNRLNILGLFPDFNYVRKNFGTLLNYVTEIDAIPTYDYSRYDEMSSAELIQYIVKTYQDMVENENGKPVERPFTLDVLQIMHLSGLAPSRKYLQRRIGGVRKINEALNFADVRSWDDEMYLKYGADILRYNGPDSLTVKNAEILGANKYGPYPAAMKRKFGSWGRFKNLAAERLHNDLAFEANHKHAVTEYYQKVDPHGRSNADFNEKAQHRALWLLIGHYSMSQSIELSLRLDIGTIDSILKRICDVSSQKVTLADIEVTALTFNIFDDVWPVALTARLPILPEKS